MSETLTSSAPSTAETQPPVGEQAAAPVGEVEDGSVQEAETSVSVDRFNGLMSSMNKEKERADQLAAKLEALESASSAPEENQLGPDSQEITEVSDTAPDPRIDALTEQVSQLTEMLQGVAGTVGETRQRTIQEEVFADFPTAEPFADLIQAEDADSYRQMAEEISNRIATVTGDGVSEEAPGGEAPQTPAPAAAAHPLEAPATGGGPPVTEPQEATDKRVEAVKAGSWDDYFGSIAEEDGEPSQV